MTVNDRARSFRLNRNATRLLYLSYVRADKGYHEICPPPHSARYVSCPYFSKLYTQQWTIGRGACNVVHKQYRVAGLGYIRSQVYHTCYNAISIQENIYHIYVVQIYYVYISIPPKTQLVDPYKYIRKTSYLFSCYKARG